MKQRLVYTYIVFLLPLFDISTEHFNLHKNESLINAPESCDIQITVPDDFVVCAGQEFNLNSEVTGDFDDLIILVNGQNSGLDPDDDVIITETTTFTIIATGESETNLIQNGDFEDGAAGFTTDYAPGTTSCFGLGFLDCEGTFGVLDDPSDGHNNFANCDDAVGGGDMMVVNGASNLQDIWCQTVCVDPDGVYIFSAWAASVNPDSPAEIQFSIDGSLIGSQIGLTSNLCDWFQFQADWEANGETSVEICVTNQNTAASGNDFALDGLEFKQVCEEEMSFTVEVIDFDVFISEPFELTCDILQSEIITDVTPDGTYTYTWDDSDGNIIEFVDDGAEVIVDQAGLYLVTITDENGCTQFFEVEVEVEAEVPELFVSSSNDLSCAESFSTLSVDSNLNGLDFEWQNDQGDVISLTDEVVVFDEGLYTVIATDFSTGCMATEVFELVSDFQIPSLSITSSNNLSCLNTTSILNVTPDDIDLEFNWFDGAGNLISVGNIASVMIPDTYYVNTVVDNPNCLSMDSIIIIEESLEPAFDIVLSNPLDCQFSSAQLNTSLVTELASWELLGSSIVFPEDDTIIISQPGTYIATLQFDNGCESFDSIIVEGIVSSFDFSITFDSTLDCNKDFSEIITLYNNQELSFEWLDLNINQIDDSVYTVNNEGNYLYELTDSNGCSVIDSITILSNFATPLVSINPDTIECDDPIAEIFFTNSNGFDVTWIDANNISIESDTFITSTPGTISFIVTGNNGCSSQGTYEISSDILPPDVLINSSPITCSNTSIEIMAQTSETDLQFNWLLPDQTSNTNQFFQTELGGTYILTVIDNNGCESNFEHEVLVDTIAPLTDLIDTFTINCINSSLDTFLLVNGDVENFGFSGTWFDPNSLDININNVGVYDIEIVGRNGCSTNEILNVGIDTVKPIIVFDDIDNLGCNNQEVNLSASVTNAYIGLEWEGGNINSTDSSVRVSQPGEYTLTAYAENGCNTIESVTVESNDDFPEFDLTIIPVNCVEEEGTISVRTSSNSDQIEVIFSTMDTFTLESDESIVTSREEEFTVIVTSINGCSSTQVSQMQFDTIANDFDLRAENLNCNKASTNIELVTSSSYERAEIFNSNGMLLGNIETQLSIQDEYSVILTYNNGCSKTNTISIRDLSTKPGISNLELTREECSVFSQIQSLDVTDGFPPYTIYVDGIQTSENELIFEEAGQYDLLVEDANGCKIDTIFEVPEINPINITELPDLELELGEEQQLNLTTNIPLEDIESIIWTPTENLSCSNCLDPIITGEQNTEYFVTVIDKEGCEASIMIRVNISETLRYFIPNVIQLSDQNNNNQFTIFSNDVTLIDQLLIYDRWGNLVFKNQNFAPNDPKLGWDGTFNNKSVEEGVYVYYALFTLKDGRLEKAAGDITFLK